MVFSFMLDSGLVCFHRHGALMMLYILRRSASRGSCRASGRIVRLYLLDD
jgi:hypothetical protein